MTVLNKGWQSLKKKHESSPFVFADTELMTVLNEEDW